ncbi:MAG: NAD-dependent epimerase/dehydratase family protein [Candidatus Ranarchaeia archaeon]
MNDQTVMITGAAGYVGRMAVEFLARAPGMKKVYISDLDKPDIAKRGTGYAFNSSMGSMLWGESADCVWTPANLLDTDNIAGVLKKIRPKAIYNCASMISSYWYVPLINWARKDDPEFNARLAGHTVAKDLDLAYHLMLGVKEADLDYEPIVVNIAFPDHTNVILHKAGLGVAAGGGTTDLTATALQYLVAKKYGVAWHNVDVGLICHHALRAAPITKDIFWLKVMVGPDNVTDEIDQLAMLKEAVHITTQGENAGMTAASGIKFLLAMMFDTDLVANCPGPSGLSGGYPVRVNKSGAHPVFPKELSKDEINRIMDEGLRYDGIDKIDNKGTVHFTETCTSLMSKFLGIERKTMPIEETHQMTLELLKGYRALDEKYKDIDIGRFF